MVIDLYNTEFWKFSFGGRFCWFFIIILSTCVGRLIPWSTFNYNFRPNKLIRALLGSWVLPKFAGNYASNFFFFLTCDNYIWQALIGCIKIFNLVIALTIQIVAMYLCIYIESIHFHYLIFDSKFDQLKHYGPWRSPWQLRPPVCGRQPYAIFGMLDFTCVVFYHLRRLKIFQVSAATPTRILFTKKNSYTHILTRVKISFIYFTTTLFYNIYLASPFAVI